MVDEAHGSGYTLAELTVEDGEIIEFIRRARAARR
jgi:hypothetical protein